MKRIIWGLTILMMAGSIWAAYPIRLVCYDPFTGEYGTPDSLQYRIKYYEYAIRTIRVPGDRVPLGGLNSPFVNDTIDSDYGGYENLSVQIVAWFHSGVLKDTVLANIDLSAYNADDSVENAIADANKGNFKATGFSTHSAGDVYTQFTSGSNEDVFKANVSALALQTEVANLDGWNPATQDYTDEAAVWAYISRTLTSETWTTTQRDSLLLAMADSSMRRKIWNAAWTYWQSAGTFGGLLHDSIDAKVSSAGATAVISTSDKEDIRDWIIDTLKNLPDDFATASSYFDSLLAAAAAGGSGSGSCSYGDGAYTRYVYVFDTSAGDTVPLNLAVVYANNIDQSGNAYYNLTNNTGRGRLQLNAGDWVIFSVAPGYQQIMDTITVSGADSDTLWTYTSAANKTTVYGSLFNPAGVPYQYAIATFELVGSSPDSLITFNDTLITRKTVIDTANISGYFSVALYANENLSDTASDYRATFKDRYGNIIERPWYCKVIDTSAVEFQALTRWR